MWLITKLLNHSKLFLTTTWKRYKDIDPKGTQANTLQKSNKDALSSPSRSPIETPSFYFLIPGCSQSLKALKITTLTMMNFQPTLTSVLSVNKHCKICKCYPFQFSQLSGFAISNCLKNLKRGLESNPVNMIIACSLAGASRCPIGNWNRITLWWCFLDGLWFCIWLVRSCLINTLIKHLKGQKYLGLLPSEVFLFLQLRLPCSQSQGNL